MRQQQRPPRLARRTLLKAAGTVAASSGLLGGVRIRRRGRLSGQALAAELPPAARGYRPAVMQAVILTVNGTEYTVEVDTRDTLANLLRERLHLTGTHVTCDRGECGACTVVVDGRAVYSCSVLAVQVQGREILTIEGLAAADGLDPIQQAFIDCDGFQCGYCTAGQIMSIKACLMREPDPTEAEIRNAVAGNICRCGAYPGIIAAGLQAAKAQRQGR